MAGRRDQIKLTEAEQAELLDSERVVVVTLERPPRLAALDAACGSSLREGEIWVWTYAKSQKVRNLERDPRATLLVETGTEYVELRGMQIEAEAELIRDPDRVAEFGDRAHRPLRGGDRVGRGRRRRRAAGPGGEAGRDPVRAGPRRHLGPPQARRHLLSPALAAASPANLTNALYAGFALPLDSSSPEVPHHEQMLGVESCQLNQSTCCTCSLWRCLRKYL